MSVEIMLYFLTVEITRSREDFPNGFSKKRSLYLLIFLKCAFFKVFTTSTGVKFSNSCLNISELNGEVSV